MANLLLNLYQIPADEAADVRELLEQAGIAWYETRPSMWGISHGGIWVREESDLPAARRLLAEYEQARSERVRAEWASARAAGTAPTFWTTLRGQPLQVLLALLAVAFALALVALPVWLLL